VTRQAIPVGEIPEGLEGVSCQSAHFNLTFANAQRSTASVLAWQHVAEEQF